VRSRALFTTSWDDGHPSDLRVAGLLARHGIAGTFYVPRHAATGTMDAVHLRELAQAFEIGAHTLSHAVLTDATPAQALHEIAGSKSWIEDETGMPCRMFCPPLGQFTRSHQAVVRQVGFLGMRSVELVSLELPRRRAGLLVMPTSVQALPHRPVAYLRNIAKRAAVRNLWLYVRYGDAPDWVAMARALVDRVAARGGVFHLWGHSWEIDRDEQWERLDDMLHMMADHAAAAAYLSNGQICAAVTGARRPRSETTCASW
jgi:peptidoglycan/xylan/chitin deacetylase (PgdA/CDA1 family)